MGTVLIYRLQPNKKLFAAMRDAQMEAAKVWNLRCKTHKQARMDHAKWLGRNELQKATRKVIAFCHSLTELYHVWY